MKGSILDVLFDNPFLIIMLIAAISTFYKKNKNKHSDQKRNSPSIDKRYQKDNEPVKDLKEVANSFSNEEKQVIQKERYETGFSNKRIGKATQTDEVSINISTLSSHVYEDKDQFKPATVTKEVDLDLNKTKIMDAVIWSEILGPPRSKKPYMKRRNRS